MPRVLNKRHDAIPPSAVYVGRPTKWGNPFPLQGEADRDNCLRKYKAYIKERPDLMEQARKELKGKDLVCWCSPKLCHADILLKIANGDSDV